LANQFIQKRLGGSGLHFVDSNVFIQELGGIYHGGAPLANGSVVWTGTKSRSTLPRSRRAVVTTRSAVCTAKRMANVDPGFLIFLLVVLVLLLSLGRYSRRAQEVNGLLYAGEYTRAAERLRTLGGPVAWLMRLLRPGALEGDIALAWALAGDLPNGTRWTELALRKARSPLAQASANNAASLLSARLGRVPEMMEHLERLRVALQRASVGPAFRYSAVAASRCMEAGDLERAIEILREARDTDEDWGSPQVRLATLLVLSCLGHDEAILADGARARALLGDPPVRTAEGTSSRLGKTAAAKRLTRLIQCEIRLTVLRAAVDAGRWQPIQDHVPWLEGLDPPSLTTAQWRLGLLGAWCVYQGDAGNARLYVTKLMELAEAHPGLPALGADVRLEAAHILHRLGDHAAVLELLQDHEWASAGPLCEAERDGLVADSLDAIGQTAEADERRHRSAARAPLARWNHDQLPVPLPEPLRESLDVVIGGLAVAEDQGSCDPMSKPPLARVTSLASPWAWALAVFAFVPVVGAVPGMALVALGAYLCFRRSPLPHDRRVGIAGLVLGLLSLAFAGLYVGHWQGWFEPAGSHEADPAAPSTWTGPVETGNGLAADDGHEGMSVPDDLEDARAKRKPADISITWPVGALYFVVLILSIVLHELGHALSAYWAGDPTARDRGRLSVNPIRHLSLFGSFIVPLVLILLPGDAFIGWAKPVPVMPSRLRRQHLGRLGVSLAGVSANLLLAFLGANLLAGGLIAIQVLNPDASALGVVMPFTLPELRQVAYAPVWAYTVEACKAVILVNAFLACFNLLPFPPLDGFGAIRAVIPSGLGRRFDRLSGLGIVILLVLIATGNLASLLLPGIYLAGLLLGFGPVLAGWM
jgi:Zn-dependent protease